MVVGRVFLTFPGISEFYILWFIVVILSTSKPEKKLGFQKLYIIYFFLYFAYRASQYIYLNINQLDALNFIMSLFYASTRFEHMCSSSGSQNCTIQSLVSSHL